MWTELNLLGAQKQGLQQLILNFIIIFFTKGEFRICGFTNRWKKNWILQIWLSWLRFILAFLTPAGIMPCISPWPLPPHTFQSIIHLSPLNSTLCNRQTYKRRYIYERSFMHVCVSIVYVCTRTEGLKSQCHLVGQTSAVDWCGLKPGLPPSETGD